MKKIPLWKGNHHHRIFSGQYAFVDDEDYARVSKWYWTLSTGYAKGRVKKKGVWHNIPLHRFIMNATRNRMVDHRDRQPLNCQKYNLRFCSKAENGWNREKSRGRSHSGLKGVYRKSGQWTAKIACRNHQYFLGYYPTEHIAALAYDFWATLLHGEFVVPNFTVVSTSEKPIGGLNGQISSPEANPVHSAMPSAGS